MSNLLEVSELRTAFDTEKGQLVAVDGVSFSVEKGKTLGVVGESGCGKSVTAMSIVQLLPQPAGTIIGGSIKFDGEELRGVTEDRLHKLRGDEIGVIFQEPMTALNPVQRVGKQIAEVLLLHKNISKQEALVRSVDLLKKVGIPAPEKRVMEFPHQLSGGMRQRVVIAIALACNPKLLIADEPTTALDVTVQAQILDLLEDLQEEFGMSTIMITHNLGVIAESCDDVIVMYAGRVVERAPVRELFANPLHAYTKGLMKSIPRLDNEPKSKLHTIRGQVASIYDFVPGCRFCQRMERDGDTLTKRADFVEIASGHWVENCPACVERGDS